MPDLPSTQTTSTLTPSNLPQTNSQPTTTNRNSTPNPNPNSTSNSNSNSNVNTRNSLPIPTSSQSYSSSTCIFFFFFFFWNIFFKLNNLFKDTRTEWTTFSSSPNVGTTSSTISASSTSTASSTVNQKPQQQQQQQQPPQQQQQSNEKPWAHSSLLFSPIFDFKKKNLFIYLLLAPSDPFGFSSSNQTSKTVPNKSFDPYDTSLFSSFPQSSFEVLFIFFFFFVFF